MQDAYDRFERRDAQQERSAAEWYADLWLRMRVDSDRTQPVIDGYDAVLALARRERGLDAA